MDAAQFPPEFWDGLEYVPLTVAALAEVNRRNGLRPPPRNPTPERPEELTRFARQGGPDLTHLRGYVPPTYNVHSS